MERSEHTLPALPPVLREVRPPELLGPSRFPDLGRCPLSVVHGLRKEELLPPDPLAVLGELVHAVRHELRGTPLGSDEEVRDAVDAAFGARKAEIEAELACIAFDPLTDVVEVGGELVEPMGHRVPNLPSLSEELLDAVEDGVFVGDIGKRHVFALADLLLEILDELT